jgi:6-phosphogluconate dehydrogenase (decarboxylating)
MEIAIVGLGKMGANKTKRLLQGGRRVVVSDLNKAAVATAVADGAVAADSLETLPSLLTAPRAVWVMVPAGGPTENVINTLATVLGSGDIIIDGGNSNYFGLDLHQIAEIWRYGSVVRSWLLDLTANALADDPKLSDIRGWVADSGEGRWTVFEAKDLDVPAPVITASLQARFVSHQGESFAAKLLAAMRNQFGGHAIKKEE